LSENEYKTSRKRRIEFGQHHLVDARIVLLLVQCLAPRSSEIILEIGSGKGNITRLISQCSRYINSYEVDPDLYESARINCLDRPNVQLYNLDALKIKPPRFDAFISNIPYSRSREIITWLCCQNFQRGVIMVQDEFSSKMLSQPGEKNYTAISVISQYCLALEIVAKVPPEAFSPPPRVTSALLRLIRKPNTIDLTEIKKIHLLFSRGKSYSLHAWHRRNNNLETRKIRNLLPEEVVDVVRKI
jgi:16S rRNA A1518/A1519 N6-dimethyltransferase RsmA/KsgA/DIM1 with predicted DNA glycosylase/AP lyase activity